MFKKGELFKLGWTHVTVLDVYFSKEKRSEDLKHNAFHAVAFYKPNSLKVHDIYPMSQIIVYDQGHMTTPYLYFNEV